MFGAQIAKGSQNLLDAGMDQRQVAALADLVGQCRASIEHEGSVELFGPLTASGDTRFRGPVLFDEPVQFGGVNGRGGDVEFNSGVEFGGDVTFLPETRRTLVPQLIELTTDMGTSATAKFKEWDGAAYVDSALATFTVYDPHFLARNAFSGQLGWAMWDADRSAFLVSAMNAPTSRRGTIDAALTRDSNQTFTDAIDGKTFEVYGQMIKSGYKIPTTARVLATWCQSENSGAGRWLATAIDNCFEVV